MTKTCYPGQVTLLQQIRHVLVWLFSGSKCDIQIVYYKNLCLRTVQPTFSSTKSCDLDAQLLVVHKSFSNSRVFICYQEDTVTIATLNASVPLCT